MISDVVISKLKKHLKKQIKTAKTELKDCSIYDSHLFKDMTERELIIYKRLLKHIGELEKQHEGPHS